MSGDMLYPPDALAAYTDLARMILAGAAKTAEEMGVPYVVWMCVIQSASTIPTPVVVEENKL